MKIILKLRQEGRKTGGCHLVSEKIQVKLESKVDWGCAFLCVLENIE